MLKALALPEAEVSILLLDDRGISALNERYLQKAGPTDVISFPMQDAALPAIQPQLLGDIAISVETAVRQAAERGISCEEELADLLIHGLLHLLGYDHETSADDRRRMRTKQRRILAQALADD